MPRGENRYSSTISLTSALIFYIPCIMFVLICLHQTNILCITFPTPSYTALLEDGADERITRRSITWCMRVGALNVRLTKTKKRDVGSFAPSLGALWSVSIWAAFHAWMVADCPLSPHFHSAYRSRRTKKLSCFATSPVQWRDPCPVVLHAFFNVNWQERLGVTVKIRRIFWPDVWCV
jgi:hypothetical protein